MAELDEETVELLRESVKRFAQRLIERLPVDKIYTRTYVVSAFLPEEAPLSSRDLPLSVEVLPDKSEGMGFWRRENLAPCSLTRVAAYSHR
jgi:hypothetical protein